MMLSLRRVTWAAEGARDARRAWPERQSLLVRLSAPDGSFGIGEASPLPGYSSDSLLGAEQALANVGAPGAAVALVNAVTALNKVAAAVATAPATAVATAPAAAPGTAFATAPPAAPPVATTARDKHDVLEALAAIAALVPAAVPSARFALEMAALDLVGKQLRMPTWALLRAATSPCVRGGNAPDDEQERRAARMPAPFPPVLRAAARRDTSGDVRGEAAGDLNTGREVSSWVDAEPSPERELSALVGPATAPGLLETALSITQQGYRHIKLKVGAPGQWRAEVAAVAALRARLDADVRIRLDANGAWSETEMAEAWATLRHLELELFEEPGQLPASLHGALPLALDESLQGLTVPDAVQRLRTSAARYCVLKPGALGGVAHCLALARAAAEWGVTAVLSHSFDGPFAWRGAAALALALPRGAAHGLAPHAGLSSWHPTPLPVRAGTLYGWSEPGLGEPAEHGFS